METSEKTRRTIKKKKVLKGGKKSNGTEK